MAALPCDICGNPPVRAQIMIEGAKLLACARCMKGGKILHRFDDEPSPINPNATVTTSTKSTEEIIEDYGKTILNAREKKGLTVVTLAEKIKEKETYIHGIEHERFSPSLEVARKLEKELKIKLVEKMSDVLSPSAPQSRSFSTPTLADMVDKKKKREK